MGEPRSLAYPNTFITVALAEWKFPLLHALMQRFKSPDGGARNEGLSEVTFLLALYI
jgi:hypothetical protein